MKTILVTGSSGQIGSNLINAWGGRVIGIDKNRNQWLDEGKFEFHQRDLLDKEWDKGVPFEDVECVVHFAANAKVFELVQDPSRALENIVSLFNSLMVANKHGIPFIFSSSREVYGNHDAEFIGSTVNETQSRVQQESPYSASKLSGEGMVHAFHSSYGLPAMILRFSNVYGRFDNDLDRMERVIPLFIKKINSGEPITVYGKDKTLDFTYVDDCIQGVIGAINRLSRDSKEVETYNIANGRGYTLGDLVGMISLALNKTPQVNWTSSLPGEVSYYVANISRAKKNLNFCPSTSLVEGVRRTVEWYRQSGFIK